MYLPQQWTTSEFWKSPSNWTWHLSSKKTIDAIESYFLENTAHHFLTHKVPVSWFLLVCVVLWRNWHLGVVVITTAQLYLAKPNFRFCEGSNPACGVSEILDCEDLWQSFRLEIRLNVGQPYHKNNSPFIITDVLPKFIGKVPN